MREAKRNTQSREAQHPLTSREAQHPFTGTSSRDMTMEETMTDHDPTT